MDNEKHNNNGRGIFYGVIGVATLVVAIIGATFAYFTASRSSNNGDITGNAASIGFGLKVERAETTDRTNGGLIPMSNSMVEQAVSSGGKAGGQGSSVPCVDDNGNSVCQIYKVTITNNSSAVLFLDGFVTLNGGLGRASDSTDVSGALTTMRWAQVFYDGSSYSTGGDTTLHADTEINIADIDTSGDTSGQNKANIYVDGSTTGTLQGSVLSPATDAEGAVKFSNNVRQVINKNYIRTSTAGNGENHSYTRADITDALVFNQRLTAADGTANSGTDEVVIYFVVWLHETGTNQTPDAQVSETVTNDDGDQFFSGTVTFLSAQGGEVSATFSGYTTVPANTLTTP